MLKATGYTISGEYEDLTIGVGEDGTSILLTQNADTVLVGLDDLEDFIKAIRAITKEIE